MSKLNPLKLRTFLLVLITLMMSACGFTSDEPTQNQGFTPQELRSDCIIDETKFEQFFDKDITGQINCLEEKFEQFSKYVKRSDQNYVGHKDLKVFVEDFFNDRATKIIDGLDLIFKINFIFLDSHENKISKADINKLFKILRSGNKSMMAINSAIKRFDNNQISIERLREVFVDQMTEFSNICLSNTNTNGLAKASISQIINDLSSKFKTFNFNDSQINQLQFAKKLVLGGDKDIIKASELQNLFGKIPHIIGNIFDHIWINDFNLKTDADYVRFINKRINSTFGIIEKQDGIVFNTDELKTILPGQIKRWSKANIINVLENNKKYLIVNDDIKNYTYKDIKLSEQYIKLALEGYILFDDVNQNIVNIINTNSSQKEVDYVKKEIEDFYQRAIKYLDTSLFPSEIFTKSFMNTSGGDLKFEESSLKRFLAVLVTKPLLVGGELDTMKAMELIPFLSKVKLLVPAGLDTVFQIKNTNDDNKKYSLMLEATKILKANLHNEKNHKIRLDHNDIKLFAYFATNHEDLVNAIHKVFPKLKKKLFQGSKDFSTGHEFHELIDFIKTNVQELYLSAINYDIYENELKSKKRISYLKFKSDDRFKQFSADSLLNFRKNFLHVIKKYKYFSNEQGYQTYDENYHRSKIGIIQTLLLRNILKKLAHNYGHYEAGSTEPMFSLKEIETMMVDFKPILEIYGLWTTKFDTFARNMILLSDLFQNSSNGNGSMDLVEGVEYFNMVLSAIKIQSGVLDKMEKYCDNIGSEENKEYDVLCYRSKYLTVILEDLNLKQYFPRLDSYVKSSSKKEIYDFIDNVEGFSRDIDDENIPMAKRDFVLLTGAMLNIESTFVRYDQINKNNLLDPNELDAAFKVYRSGIISVAELEKDQEKYAKSIFLYMVKNMKIPSKFDLFIFHNTGGGKRVVAKRLNIGAILYYLAVSGGSEESE